MTNSNQLWQARKTRTSIWKLEIMTPLGNISLNKIQEKIARMFMKQSYGHAFQLVKGCSAFTCIRHYELNGEVSNIVAHGKGEEANMPRLMLSGIFT
jgi:hypothetical protein